VRRGEIWWADLDPPVGRRPVVLLTRDEACGTRNQVTIGPVTTRVRGIPVEVELGPEDGLPKTCAINLDTIATIPKAALDVRIVQLRPEKMQAVDDAIRFALGIDGR
jgi:mRNA interferase MazF